MSIFWLILSLILLYFSKNLLVGQFTRLIHRLGGGQHGAIITWSIFFLPGTIIHEISHFLIAALTGARTGKIEIFPEYLEEKNKEKGGVALGYVETQTLNPIQGFLVGIAPFVSGAIILVYLASLIQLSFQDKNYQLLALELYLFFTVANSFFPSWSDIKQTLPLIVISLIVVVLAWYFGFQLLISPSSEIWILIETLTNTIVISVILNVFVFGLIFTINKIKFRRK